MRTLAGSDEGIPITSTTNDVVVRRITVDDWRRLRQIRIEALSNSPMAFITTADEARQDPDSLWRSRAEQGASGDGQVTMLAVAGDDAVGMAVGFRRTKRPLDVVPVVAVFVSERARRLGVGARLMAGVEEWAVSVGGRTTSLWVVDGNDGARRFYESLGYTATLDRQRITVPPVRWETRMQKPLTAG